MNTAKQDKKTFSNHAICKKSGGNIFTEKPLFCEGGQSLVVTSGESCHLYNTSTGDHVSELFKCNENIISCQLHPGDPSNIITSTENGHITIFNLESKKIEKEVLLIIKPKWLNAKGYQKYNLGGKPERVNWENENVNELKSRKFHHVLVKPIFNSKSKFIVWATWSLNDEDHSHTSTFTLKGRHYLFAAVPQIGLKRCHQNFAVSHYNNCDIFVGMSANFILVINIYDKCGHYTYKKHLIQDHLEFTSLEFHPIECCFASGDSLGRVMLWRNIFENRPLKEEFHWHCLPVQTITFSDRGSFLYTGGDENVLVKWSLETQQRDFLPRLSSTIHHISVAPGSNLMSISTTDNRILIINANFESISVIQHFSKWSALGHNQVRNVFTKDPRTDALILNGKSGHLQFFSPRDKGRLLYTLDVTNKNILTGRKDFESVNTEVTHARFSNSGKWMVTAESRDAELSVESRLKFWEYDEVLQKFVLNTSMELPHEGCCIFAMEMSSDDILATTGPDNKFKLWALFELPNVQKTKQVWALLKFATFRLLPCKAVDFSQDASLVSVSFGPVLTLWETSSCILKCSLTPPLKRDDVNFVRFGRSESSHLVLTASTAWLSAWNVITLCMVWTVQLRTTLLSSDPFSNYMCAFSNKNSLFIFNPSSPSPELKIEKVSESSVVAANFVHNDADSPQLYFLTSNQELFSLENAESAKQDLLNVEPRKHMTPFSAQIAQHANVDVVKTEKTRLVLSKLGSEFAATILDSPAHVLPNPSLLCADILKSLILTTMPPASASSFVSNAPDDDVTEVLHVATEEKTVDDISIDDQLSKTLRDLFK